MDFASWSQHLNNTDDLYSCCRSAVNPIVLSPALGKLLSCSWYSVVLLGTSSHCSIQSVTMSWSCLVIFAIQRSPVRGRHKWMQLQSMFEWSPLCWWQEWLPLHVCKRVHRYNLLSLSQPLLFLTKKICLPGLPKVFPSHCYVAIYIILYVLIWM